MKTRLQSFLTILLLLICMLAASSVALAAVERDLAVPRSPSAPPALTQVADIFAGPQSSNPSFFVARGDTIFFNAIDPTYGKELWYSNPVTGTALLADINAGPTESNPENLTLYDGEIYFTADDGTTGKELWKSDGTPGNATQVVDIRTGPLGSSPSKLKISGDRLYLVADDGNGVELWTYHAGTTTSQLLDINPTTGSGPTILTDVNGVLFFRASGSANNEELWKSEGTPGTTVQVKNINPSGSSAPQDLANLNGVLYFTADDGTNGRELWRSDGTDAGTYMVVDLSSDPLNPGPDKLTVSGGVLFFNVLDPATGRELWRSDGTAGGTYLVKDLNPGAASTNPSSLVDLNGILYFLGRDASRGRELFRSDGTEAGTYLVKDINPGTGDSDPEHMTRVNQLLFFSADDGTHGRELWRSNGVSTGTSLVGDINPGAASSAVTNITGTPSRAYFDLDDGSDGRELWTIDLTNTPPTASVSGPFAGQEGQAVPLSASASDPDDNTLSFVWTADPPLCTFSDPNTLQPTVSCADNGAYTLTLTVLDWWAEAAVDTGTLTLVNANPEIQTMTFGPASVGLPVSLQASFGDPGSADTHTATVTWGTGSTPQPAAVDQDGNTISAQHIFSSTGTYLVTLDLQDDDGGSDSLQMPLEVYYRLALPLMKNE
jgi:ELWxxDGT repeat protein